MNTRHLIAKDLLAAFDMMPSFTLNDATLPEMRDLRTDAFGAPADEVGGVAVSERFVAGSADAPEVRMLVYQPDGHDGRNPAVLHIHGGGYVMGTPEMFDLPNKRLCRDPGCVVVSVDYRLAPETPHPGPVEDCYAALAWLHGNADDLNVDPNRIAVKGESAGGGLAAGLALLTRDRGEIELCHQHLTFPMIDDREPQTPHEHVGEFVWNRESNRYGWASLLGCAPGSEGVSPYAAAARADDLSNLPATFIATAALDLFLEENLEYARRLTRAGVPVELHVYPGAYHGFMLTPDARSSRQYAADSEAALRDAFEV